MSKTNLPWGRLGSDQVVVVNDAFQEVVPLLKLVRYLLILHISKSNWHPADLKSLIIQNQKAASYYGLQSEFPTIIMDLFTLRLDTFDLEDSQADSLVSYSWAPISSYNSPTNSLSVTKQKVGSEVLSPLYYIYSLRDNSIFSKADRELEYCSLSTAWFQMTLLMIVEAWDMLGRSSGATESISLIRHTSSLEQLSLHQPIKFRSWNSLTSEFRQMESKLRRWHRVKARAPRVKTAPLSGSTLACFNSSGFSKRVLQLLFLAQLWVANISGEYDITYLLGSSRTSTLEREILGSQSPLKDSNIKEDRRQSRTLTTYLSEYFKQCCFFESISFYKVTGRCSYWTTTSNPFLHSKTFGKLRMVGESIYFRVLSNTSKESLVCLDSKQYVFSTRMRAPSVTRLWCPQDSFQSDYGDAFPIGRLIDYSDIVNTGKYLSEGSTYQVKTMAIVDSLSRYRSRCLDFYREMCFSIFNQVSVYLTPNQHEIDFFQIVKSVVILDLGQHLNTLVELPELHSCLCYVLILVDLVSIKVKPHFFLRDHDQRTAPLQQIFFPSKQLLSQCIEFIYSLVLGTQTPVFTFNFGRLYIQELLALFHDSDQLRQHKDAVREQILIYNFQIFITFLSKERSQE